MLPIDWIIVTVCVIFLIVASWAPGERVYIKSPARDVWDWLRRRLAR